MIFRQLTPQNDWSFGNGISSYAVNQQAIALNIETAVLMWAGDSYWSLNGWINWKGLLNVGRQAALNSALQALLLQCYGVMQVVSASVQFNPGTRAITASYVLNTVYSQQIVNSVQLLSGNPTQAVVN